MQTNIVLTLTGPDRVGLVEAVTKLLLNRGGNVETSRMSRLGGAFAILMLVSIPAEQVTHLDQEFAALIAQGYKVTVSETEQAQAAPQAGWQPYQIDVQGADQEGIIYQVSQMLAQRGINIESADTRTAPAAMSGDPLFSMTALVFVPPTLTGTDWQADLQAVARQMNVDIVVSSGPNTKPYP